MFSTSYILVNSLASFETDEDLREALEFLKGIGYSGVEFDVGDPPRGDVDRVAELASELGMSVPSMMTGAAYADGLCLSSPDVSVRKETVARLSSFVEIASRVGAVLVVGLLQGLRSDEPDEARAKDRIVEALREVALNAEERGVALVLEPVNHLQVGFNNSVAEALETIERVGSAALGPMVDTLHMHIEERSPVQSVLEVGKRIRHVHIAESNGSLFGSGNADLHAVVQALDEIGYERFASVKIYRAESWRDAARGAMEYLAGG